jgi:hypothetical protein
MKNSTKAKTEETAVVVASFHPINDVPDKAPAPKFDPGNPNLTFDDVQPANYFSMESLEQWLEERGAESRILTITGASTEFIYDPEKGTETGSWKPCLSFAETDTLLVINVTRNGQMKKLTNSPFLRDWAKAGRIAIRPGIANGKAQIVIAAAPDYGGEEISDMFSYG